MTVATRLPRYRGQAPASEVVAVLVDDATAGTVARAAVWTAVRLGARIRFLQLVIDGRGADAAAASDRRTFVAAVEALQGSNLRAAFEVVAGDPVGRLTEVGRRAVRLVLADDRSHTGAGLVLACLRAGVCPLELVVAEGGVDGS